MTPTPFRVTPKPKVLMSASRVKRPLDVSEAVAPLVARLPVRVSALELVNSKLPFAVKAPKFVRVLLFVKATVLPVLPVSVLALRTLAPFCVIPEAMLAAVPKLIVPLVAVMLPRATVDAF